MGTRAIIRMEGKPIFATHWDGNPSSLGAELVKADGNLDKIIGVAKGHTLDGASTKMRDLLNEERLAQIAQRANLQKGTPKYSVESLKKLASEGRQLTFGVHTPEDSPIDDIKDYGDFAEWEYNIKGGKVFARPLDGTWNPKKDVGTWTLLETAEKADQYEDAQRKISDAAYVRKELATAKKDPIYGVKGIMREVESSGHSEGDEWIVDSYKKELDQRDKEMINTYLKVPQVRNLIGKGWHYESLRHKLAAYGIKTNPFKNNMPKMRSMYKVSKR